VKLLKLLVLLFVLVACSSAAPKRDFSVILYKTDAECVKWKLEGQVFELCKRDEGFPQKLIGISATDYAKERDFQDLLINRCKKWKKK